MKKSALFQPISLSLFMLLCVSCGKTERSTTNSTKAARAISRALFDANEAMKEFATKQGLMEDPRVKAADDMFFKAHKEVTKIRKAHPDLMSIYEKSDALEEQMIQFTLNKDKAAYEQAKKDYKTVRTELERVANTLPEIIEAQRQVTKVRENQAFVLCDVVAESGAAGKKMADHVRTLRNQLQASRN